MRHSASTSDVGCAGIKRQIRKPTVSEADWQSPEAGIRNKRTQPEADLQLRTHPPE